ncbi:MAG: hypothetical protein ACOX7H_04495 [Bacillota bacterium]
MKNRLVLSEMGATAKVSTDIGLSQLPMLVTVKHTYSAAKSDGKYRSKYHGKNDHYHDLAESMKSLPQEIADPVMIMASATKDDSAVILAEMIGEENRPVIVAVKANGYGYYNDIEIDANIMTSTYGKDGINNFIARAYKEDRVLYFNNEKSQLLRNRPGVQFPDGLASADFTNSIRKFKEKINKNKILPPKHLDRHIPPSPTASFAKSALLASKAAPDLIRK